MLHASICSGSTFPYFQAKFHGNSNFQEKIQNIIFFIEKLAHDWSYNTKITPKNLHFFTGEVS